MNFGLDEPELSVTVNYTYTKDDSEEEISDVCVIHISRNPEELKAAEEAEGTGENAEAVSMYVRVEELEKCLLSKTNKRVLGLR